MPRRNTNITSPYWAWRRPPPSSRWNTSSGRRRPAPVIPAIPNTPPVNQNLTTLPGNVLAIIHGYATDHLAAADGAQVHAGLMTISHQMQHALQPYLPNLPQVWRDSNMVLSSIPAAMPYPASARDLEIILQLQQFTSNAPLNPALNPALFTKGHLPPPAIPMGGNLTGLVWYATSAAGNLGHGINRPTYDAYRNNFPPAAQGTVGWMRRNWEWIFNVNGPDPILPHEWPTKYHANGKLHPAHERVKQRFSRSYYQKIYTLTFRIENWTQWEQYYTAAPLPNFSGLVPAAKDILMLLAWMPDGRRPRIVVRGPGAVTLEAILICCRDQHSGQPGDAAFSVRAVQLDAMMRGSGAPAGWAKIIINKNIDFMAGGR